MQIEDFYEISALLDIVHKAATAGPSFAWFGAQATARLRDIQAREDAPPSVPVPITPTPAPGPAPSPVAIPSAQFEQDPPPSPVEPELPLPTPTATRRTYDGLPGPAEAI